MESLDYQHQFELMKKNAVEAFKKALNIRGYSTKRNIVVRDVWVDDSKDTMNWEDQRAAVRNDATWGVPIYASLDLTDDKGKVLSTAKKLKVAVLPKNTSMGSFIVNGKHYQVQSQLRRKPGIYVVQKANNVLQTEVHVAGRPFDIAYNRETGVFGLLRGSNTTRIPLYPVLSRLGVSDAALAKEWGEDVLRANKAISPQKAENAVLSVAEYLTSTKFKSADSAAQAIAEHLDQSEVRPEVTKTTIGKEMTKLSPLAMVRGATELLKTYRGERKPDDRQSLEYKKVLSASDLMRERFFKPNGELAAPLNQIRGRIARRLTNRREPPEKIDRVVQTGELTPLIENFYTQSPLASVADQHNPISMLSGLSQATILGEGAITNIRQARETDREVHPSHLGYIDPVHTPESDKTGLVSHFAVGVAKDGESLVTQVWNPRSNKTEYIKPSDMRQRVVAFPDQYKNGKPIANKVRALVNNDVVYVDARKVDSVLRRPQQAFSSASNAIPFMPSASAVRAQMAAKMLNQAIPLTEREAPLVQVDIGRVTLEDVIGRGFSVTAGEDGVVEKVTPNRVSIRTKDGVIEHELFNNLPLMDKSFLHADPLVKPGDNVTKGQVLADSNFTKGGTLAIGTNLRAAYIPFKGYNFEDGIVITESAAKKLTSEHLHQFEATADTGSVFSLADYNAFKPDLTVDQQEKLDKDGVVRKGQVVTKGDPIWVGTKENRYDPEYIAMKRLVPNFSPKKGHKETWESDYDGVVTDVVKRGKNVKVFIKTKEPAQVGDKLANRHAAKGIITKIIPDGEAPYDKEGKPVDILLNPQGIVGRINPSQILETAAARLAEAKGKPYRVDNFSGEDYAKKVSDELAKAKIGDTEVLYDPHTKKPLGEILVGPQYTIKLSKQATSQFSARAEGKYDINRAPASGGEEGGKALDMLTMYGMLAHGSRANLREMATYKAEKNDQFWQWLSAGSGHGLLRPPPKPTFAYQKFESYMKGAGVNMERRGSKIVLGPMTDREVKKLSSGKVKDAVFIRSKDLADEPGGLTDPNIFGANKDKWGHLELSEPIPNPMFEDAIKNLTGLKGAQFDNLVRGRTKLDPETGEIGTEGALTGGAAIQHLLSQINVDEEIKHWTEQAKQAKSATKLDVANKRLRYLTAIKKNNIDPAKDYIQTTLPLIPTQFRPIVELPDGRLSNPGVNTLYRDITLVNNELEWQKDVPFIPDEKKAELRAALYDAAKAVSGLGKPVTFFQEKRRPKGFVEQIKGETAKSGFFQSKVLRRNQNLVGRGTIIPEPKLGLDEVGIPEEMAWNIFQPFVVRRMVNLGRKPLEALRQVDERTEAAKSALLAEMEERPVILNRAPTLHKLGVLGFKPKMVSGRAIKIPPLVVAGFNADFDGDTMTVHVPIMPDAVEEVKKMMPSKHLYNPGSGFLTVLPQHESIMGLYFASQNPEGKKKILSFLPETMQKEYANKVFDKSTVKNLMSDLAKNHPDDYGNVVDNLKKLGDEAVYQAGFTVTLNDLQPKIPGRDQIFRKAEAAVSKLNLSKPEQREKANQILQQANAELDGVLQKALRQQNNNFNLMVESGARGNFKQLKQTVSTPFLVADHRGQISGTPVTRSFGQGLPFSDYWQTTYGARSTVVDKQLQTSEPGAFNKDVLATAVTAVIGKNDCGTKKGISLDVTKNGRDIPGRYLAKDVMIKGKVIAPAGTLVTPSLFNTMRDSKVGQVEVRSPLTCSLPKGLCAKCYGLNENGVEAGIGDNVGANSGQAISEPLTQMVLRTFHMGGLAGSRGIFSDYEKVDKLLKMPKIKEGKAILAPISGRVEKIKQAPGKTGREVFIGKRRDPLFIPEELWDSSKVRVGSEIKKGDALSDGMIQPDELADLKGLLPAQLYVADELQKAYNNQGVSLLRRPIETVLRSAGNTTKVLDPGESDFLPGDVAPWTVVEDFNNKPVGKRPVAQSIGRTVQEDIPGVKRGTVIDEKVQGILKNLGKSEVEVGPAPIRHKPFLKGIQQIPALRKDWMAQLGYQRLSEAITHGAATAGETDIHDYSPIPAFAYGAEFGQAENGRSISEGVY